MTRRFAVRQARFGPRRVGYKERAMERIAVCGSGYVGLVTAACLAHMGHDVCAYDNDATKIRSMQRGALPFFEPRLEAVAARERKNGRLHFAGSAREALPGRGIVFIAVGTPVDPSGDADLTYVRQAAREIAQYGEPGLLVVNKSTVPVETADVVMRLLSRLAPQRAFGVASNPEFLREGSAVDDFLHPDRIVIGCDDSTAAQRLRDLYAPLGAPTLVTDTHTAEAIKYAANAFLALKISYANELADYCESFGAAVDRVLEGIGLDRRIGREYFRPGLGFGGSCLPKDLLALAHMARKSGSEPALLDAALAVNARRPAQFVRRIERTLGDLDGAGVAVLGVAFKPLTDDTRESPAIALAGALAAKGAEVRVHDPEVPAAAVRRALPRALVCRNPYAACAGARCVVLATEWPVYATLDWHRIRAAMDAEPVMFDARNALDAASVRSAGIRYEGVGRCAREPVSA